MTLIRNSCKYIKIKSARTSIQANQKQQLKKFERSNSFATSYIIREYSFHNKLNVQFCTKQKLCLRNASLVRKFQNDHHCHSKVEGSSPPFWGMRIEFEVILSKLKEGGILLEHPRVVLELGDIHAV